MIAWIAKPMLAGLVLAAAGPALPGIDIRRTCAATAAGDNPGSCVSEEAYAKKKLVKYWNRTPAKIKAQCLYTARPPAPSYISLRDCINNALMVKQIHGQQ